MYVHVNTKYIIFLSFTKITKQHTPAPRTALVHLRMPYVNRENQDRQANTRKTD